MDELRLLVRRAELEELLYDVVAEDVGHEGVRRRRDLLKDERLLRRRGALQLLLDEPRAVLVLAELDHVRLQLPQSDVRVPVVPEIGGSIVIKGEGTVALLHECHLQLSY